MFKKKKEKNRINKKGRNFFISSLAVICFLVLFAGVGMASATNYYVATDGSDSNLGTSLDHPWQHPSYATQQAQAGDTIYLLDDTWYNEHLVFANSGTETHPITLKAYSGTPTLDGVDKRGIGITIQDKSYLSLSGFRMKNYGTAINGEGFWRHISISDFTIEDTDREGICLTGASIQNSGITDFTTQRTGLSAIHRTGSSVCSDVTISNFVIKDIPDTPGTAGIWWEQVDGLLIQHGEIRNGYHGIQLQRSIDNTIIDDVKVYDVDFHGICITDPDWGPYPCHDNIIRNCYVAYSGHNDIDLHSGAYNTLIENCELTGDSSMGAGIYFHNEGAGLTVRDCVIYGASLASSDVFKGIDLCARPNALIEGCTLYNLKSAIDGSGGDYTIRNNVVGDTAYSDTINVGSANIVCENNDIRGGRYRINRGHGLVRNSLGNSYSVCSEYGATITIEYTDGKSFSVDGGGSYTTYVITSRNHEIEVLGEATTGTISGLVTTTTGSPIAGATVTVEGAGKSDDTDSLGTYTITDVAVGTYTVTASAPGYEDASSLAVKVNKDEITTLNFLLTAGPAQDTTHPAAVTDLATTEPDSHSITLVWTAPGDDEDTGIATKYDIRYSRSEITAANWDVAIKCTDEPTPEEAGSTEIFTVTGLSPDTTYYFALKTADEVSNWSNISNSVSGTTTEVVVELAGYWKFDEGSGNTAQDSSGNNNDGTIQGASWTEGKEEKGLSFDGTNDYVDCGQDTGLKMTGAITVEAWVKWTSAGNPYFVTKTGGSGCRSYDLSGNADGTVEFRVGDGGSFKSSGSAPIPTGEWVYVVGTYEPSNYVRLFVNGALAEEETTSIPAAQGDNGLSWNIGAREGNQGWFNGDIDEVKIHNGALSAEEIRANYEANPTNNPPAAIIDSITPETAEQGKDTVSFSGHGTDTDGLVVAYNWRSSMDGQLSTASSYSKPASELSAGTHTIYFKVQDDNGAWSTEVTEELRINQELENLPPVADPKGPYTGTEGVSITFDGSTSSDPDGSIDSYLWDFGDGNTSSEVTPTQTYAQDGTYTIALKVTDNDGATNTSITTATIADTEPTADFTATPTSGEEPLTVTFTDNSASYDGIETWDWDFDNDDVTDSTAQNPTYMYAEEGIYTVSLTVTESDGHCDTMTKMDYISVTGVNNAPYVPDNPSPSDGATEVTLDETLSWTGGDPDAEDTVTYDIYFGTSITPPLVAEHQLENTYDPGMLYHSTEYYWQIVAKDNHGASKGSEVWGFVTDSAPDPDLVAEWDLDEGSGVTAVDSSGNGNDGTLVNNPTRVTGKVGKGLSFDGTNDYVDCGQDTSLKITGAITVEAWVKWSDVGNHYFVTKTGWSGRRSYDLSGNSDGTVEFRVGGADCNTFKSSGSAPIPRGEWVYVVGTYEPSNYVRLFVNGALTEEETTSIPAAQGDNGLSWYIGAREGNQGWFNGVIDEVKIHNGALSAEEIRANYEANPTNQPPAAIIDSITPETAEQGKDTVSFSGHGTDTDGLVVAYNWRSSMDGRLSTASTYSKPASELSAGTHTIYFTVQDDDGAWSTEVTEELRINQEPENFLPAADPKGPYTGTEGEQITFDGSASSDPDGSIVAYVWDFGDGNISSAVTATHTYAQDGIYTVTLTVTDNDGATNTSITTATIADTEPTADFTATPTSGEEPLTVTFTDNSISYDGIVTWDWDFDNDDVTDSTAQNPTYMYAEEGIYTVSLTVTESDGHCDTMTKMDYISVTGVNNAPYVPDNPSPSDGATEVTLDETLSWTGGDPDAEDTVTYDIYFGTSITPPLVAEHQSENTYDPGMLDHSTEYYWQIVAKDNHGASKVSEVWGFVTDSAPDPDLVAEWDLDEGSGVTAVDSSGNGNDGTLVNNPTRVTGKVGKGLSFDGTNDYVDCGQDTSLKITGAITVEAWVKWSGMDNPYFVTKTGWSGRRSYDLSGNSDGTVEFRVGGADCSTFKSSGRAPIARGEWVYLVGTYEPSNYVRLFVNGALAEEETTSIPAAQGDNGLSWYIGAREGNQGWFNGVIDEVKIHNGALSAEEIRANYDANPTNQPPAAIIDSITPETAEQGKDTVSFSGHGTDTDGLVVAYNWRSDVDSQLSTASSYSKPATELSVGTHTIYFKVQDDNGAWSTEATEELTIIEPANQHPFTPAEPSPSDGATEVSIDEALSWTGGDPDADDTVTYEVYFGTSITPLLVAEDQQETTYEPGTLDHSTEYYWRIVATDNHGASKVSEVWSFVTDSAPDPDLVAEWDLDEGSGVTAVDSSGNGNDGTLVNNPTWVTGKVGKGLSFDGTNDYVDCGQDTSLKITGAITVEAWVKWSGTDNPYFVTKTGWSGRRSYDLSGNADGTVEFRVGGADCNTFKSSGRAPIAKGEWVYLVGTYEPSSYVRLFVNGALAEEETASIPASQGDNGLPWYIGAREGNQGWFNGDMDEVKIHNGALSAEEIRENYDAYPTNQPPVADPRGTYTGTEGVALTFDGSTSSDPDGNIESYLWDFGDGHTVTELTPTHTYAQDGEYTVTLTVTDSEGATDTYTTTATIADTEPGADFSATSTGGRGPLTVDFSSNSASYDGIDAWEWDFDNDGEIDSTEQNPPHVYTEGGVYTVSLTVYESDGGCDTMTKDDYIEVAREKMKMKRNP